MKYYLETVDSVCKSIDSGSEGLNSAVAQKRLEENGKNKLVEPLRILS